MYELGTFALIIVGMGAAVKVFIINPYRGAKHVANVVRPNADKYDKEDSKEVLRVVGNQTLNYFGFIGSFLLVSILAIPIALLRLPYFINLILGLGAASFVVFSYYHFQNRDY
jgi:hypothetical protein